MKNRIKQLILDMKYEYAYLAMENMSLEEKWNYISEELYDEEPKAVYIFLLYLVAKDGHEAEWHYNCYLYFVFCNPFFDDTMKLAAWHIKQALLLDRDNVDYNKQVITTLYSYPEQFFSNEELLECAKAVLGCESENADAKCILKKLRFEPYLNCN